MKLPFYSTDGTTSAEKDFPGFPAFEGDRGLMALRQYVVAYQANQRQGNAKTKTRSEVSGTGKKPFRQKGTGMARQGSRRSPLHPGGGVVFGPRPRDYSQKVNRKVKRLALARALFDRATEGGLRVVEGWEVAEAKTKHFSEIIGRIHPEGKVLVVDERFGEKELLAARNIERVYLEEASSINPFDFVRFERIAISAPALENLLNRLNGGAQ